MPKCVSKGLFCVWIFMIQWSNLVELCKLFWYSFSYKLKLLHNAVKTQQKKIGKKKLKVLFRLSYKRNRS